MYSKYMSSVYVHIPKKDNGITLFAEGTLLSQIDKDQYYELELAKSKCIVLYYKLHFNHRRLFIVCDPRLMQNKFVKDFTLVSDSLSVIAELHGRGFDRFKRSIEYLNKATDNQIMDLPPAFFWQLAYICRNGKNDKANLNKLANNYNLDVKEVVWK